MYSCTNINEVLEIFPPKTYIFQIILTDKSYWMSSNHLPLTHLAVCEACVEQLMSKSIMLQKDSQLVLHHENMNTYNQYVKND